MDDNLVRLDEAQYTELRDILEEDFDELIRSFFSDSAARILEIKQAYNSNDNRAGYEAVHALKGASVNLGANYLADLCYKLQNQCANNYILGSQALIELIEKERLELVAELESRMS